MIEQTFPIGSVNQLKDWIKNRAKAEGIPANTILQSFMMERFLERVARSDYRDNFILKGGFLIAAIIGIDMRSTMDMDTTLKGVPVGEESIRKIIQEIMAIELADHTVFELQGIKPIHEMGAYEDYRLSMEASFFTVKVNVKLDITTGDTIIPKEIDYAYPLLFENRTIPIKAYNLYTILAEKIESILARNVTNTRARDFYDVYVLLKKYSADINKQELQQAIGVKADERKTTNAIARYDYYLAEIEKSEELKSIWRNYQRKYPYADGISYESLIVCIKSIYD